MDQNDKSSNSFFRELKRRKVTRTCILYVLVCWGVLQVGDIIYRMNRQPVTSSEQLRELISAMEPGEPVAFQVERDGRLRFVATDIP